MSKVIQFLESMGRDASLRRMSVEEFSAAVAALDVDQAQRDALLLRDHAALNDLLGGRATQMMMSLFPVEEPKRQDDDKSDEDGEGEDKPSESIRRH